jgi:hypothetical protein
MIISLLDDNLIGRNVNLFGTLGLANGNGYVLASLKQSQGESRIEAFGAKASVRHLTSFRFNL